MTSKKMLAMLAAVLVVGAGHAQALSLSLGRNPEHHSSSISATSKVAGWQSKKSTLPLRFAQGKHGNLTTGLWGKAFQFSKSTCTAYGHGKPKRVTKVVVAHRNGKKIFKTVVQKTGGEDRWSRRNQSATDVDLREPTDTVAGVCAASTKDPRGVNKGDIIVPAIEDFRYAYVNVDNGIAVTLQKARRTIHRIVTLKSPGKNGKVVLKRIKRTLLRPFRNDDTTIDLCRNSGQFWPDEDIPVIVIKYIGPPFSSLSRDEKESLMRQAPGVARNYIAMLGLGKSRFASANTVHNRFH